MIDNLMQLLSRLTETRTKAIRDLAAVDALADWLIVVLLEDEKRLAAPEFCGSPWPTPAQLLRQAKATRATVEVYRAVSREPESRDRETPQYVQRYVMGKVVQLLGMGYADRPGYRAEWQA